jgi:hypothetical protein
MGKKNYLITIELDYFKTCTSGEMFGTKGEFYFVCVNIFYKNYRIHKEHQVTQIQ